MRTSGRFAPRVLFVTHNVPRAAGDIAGSFVLRLAVALQAAGARVDIIAPGAAGLARNDALEGVRITRVRYASDARMTLAYTGTMAEAVQGSWSGRLALVQLLWQLRRATRRAIAAAAQAGDPYTLVHAHWWFPSALALKGALTSETPYPVTGSGLVMYDFGNPWPPPGNKPPVDAVGDPHGKPRSLPEHNAQMLHFYRTGEIIDTCGGDGCTPN